MQKQRGFLLVDVILGVVLFSLVVSAIIGTLIFSQQSRFSASQRQRALDIAEEGLEAVRNMRDESYTAITLGDNGLSTTSARWDVSGTSDVVEGVFTRKVTISQISNTRRNVVSTVTWNVTEGNQAQVSLFSRLTNWRRLTTGSTPTLFGVLDLTSANSGNNNADGRSIAFSNPYVYLGRTGSTGNEFYVIDVSNPATPSLTGQLALDGDPNSIAVSGNYAYVASTDNSSELQVIDVSTPAAPVLAGVFDLTTVNSGSNAANALSLAIEGTSLYLTRANSAGREFTIFNITVPTAPVIVGAIDLDGDINDITVSGSYAYVASTDNNSELQVIDISVPILPALTASLNLDSGSAGADGEAISYYSNDTDDVILFGRHGTAGSPELYIINVNTPTSPSLTSTLDMGNSNTIHAIDTATTSQLAFIASRQSSANDYRVVDISDFVTPTELTTLNLNGIPHDLVYGYIPDKVFVASDANTEELEVVAP